MKQIFFWRFCCFANYFDGIKEQQQKKKSFIFVLLHGLDQKSWAYYKEIRCDETILDMCHLCDISAHV